LAKSKAKAEPLQDKEVSTSELAAVIGKTPQWIRQLTRDNILKQIGRGKYLLGETVQAYIDHAAGGKEEDNKPRLIDERTAHERIKREKAELELEHMKGNLHAAVDVERLLSDLILTTKSRLLGVPSRISTECEHEPADVVETIVRREIETALSALAKYTPDKIGGEIDHGETENN
jgi:phage terminase Nu1 subunit (DNA packaging protein)